MKKLMEIFVNTILILGLLLIVQTNKTLAAGTFNTAVELKENIAVEERIEVGEEDYYYFITQESALYEIETVSGIDSYGYLYDENYNEIISNDDGGEGSNFKISKVLEANKKYYVKVKGCYTFTEGNYKIVLKKLKLSSISGKVSLPSGQVAPAGGIEVNIKSIKVINEVDMLYSTNVRIYIGQGQNSAEYIMPVESGEDGSKYKIKYDLYSGTYINEGYYNISKTTVDTNSASVIQVNGLDITGINMTLIPIKKIIGKVSLPNGQVAPAEGLDVKIQSIRIIGENDWQYGLNKSVRIASGQNSVDYIMPIGYGEAGSKYKMMYSISSEDYVNKGYYNTNGTVIDIASASVIESNGIDITGIDIKLLLAKKIIGKVSLPNGQVAPAGGIDINILSKKIISENNLEYGFSKLVRIEAGKNSVDYGISIGYGEAGYKYKMMYSISNEDYVYNGYYNTNGTVIDINSASVIETNGADIIGIDITLLPANRITGKVSLSNGKVAPTGGIDIYIQTIKMINGYDWQQEWNKKVHIVEGQNSTEYSIYASCDQTSSKYKIRYEVYRQDYISQGYYNINGTVIDSNSASVIEVKGTDIAGIDITLLTVKKIAGKVSLPNGKVAPTGGIDVSIRPMRKRDENSWIYESITMVHIVEGQNSTEYSIYASCDQTSSKYKIRYEVYRQDYISQGYYNINGTVIDSNSASVIEVKGTDIAGIDITLLTVKKIAGKVSLPNGKVAPTGGIDVSIRPMRKTDENSWIYESIAMVHIEEGKNEAAYSIVVPKEIQSASYIIMYDYYDTSKGMYVKNGYYNSIKTTTNLEKATSVEFSNNDVENINMILIPGKLIRGTINIPDNIGTYYGGVSLTIVANNEIDDIKVQTNISLSNGVKSSEYNLMVPSDASLNYKVNYELTGYYYVNLLKRGYYNTNGTVANRDDASLISIKGEEINSIDMTLLTGEEQYKISIEDRGQLPKIQAIYFEGQQAPYEFDYRISLLSDISKVDSKYVITLKRFNWSKANKYYVWINDGTYLLKQVLTSDDSGKTIVLKPDDTYTNTKIDIYNAGINFRMQNFCLYENGHNGNTMFIGNINNDMYIPAGEYGIQISGCNATDGYSLLKDNVNISKENNIIYFKEGELAKLDINMKDNTDSELKLLVFYAAYFNILCPLSTGYNMDSIYVSKANYDAVWINFTTKDNWRYEFSISDANISEDKTLNFDSELSCKINLNNSHFLPNEHRYIENELEVTDGYGNRLNRIFNLSNQEFKNIKGKIKLENATEKYELNVDNLYEPYIVLPNTNGTFYMTFYVEGGPIKIKSASTVITIGDPNGGTIINYDLNSDGSVDINDIETLGEAYGTENGDSSYDVNEDLNGDGVIDIFDLVILSKKIK